MNKWQKTYLEQKLWNDNPFLVKPYKSRSLPTIGGTKKCRCCKNVLFTSEFANDKRFADKKIPVCTNCLSKKDSSKAQTILNKIKYKKLCKKCRTKKQLGEFKVDRGQYGDNELLSVCIACLD
jgi:hypothetical protein